MKEISVVIPCYNVEKYIDECVESLVNQTFGIERMELIFVNDASTDSTLEKLAAWEQKYPDSIIVVTLLENSKQGTARNIGMEYASGTYLGFVDSDDYVELDMFQRMYELHEKEDVDCIICARYNEVFRDGKLQQSELGPKKDGILDVTNEKNKSYILGQKAPGGVYQHFFKREWLMALEIYFPENLKYEDNFWGGVLKYYINKVGLISAPLYHYRINETSTVQLRNAFHHLDRLKIELMKLDELMKRNLYEKYKENIEYEFLHLYFANTIITMVTKMDEIPAGIVLEMQRTVKILFPNWKENEMLKQQSYIRELCNLIDYPLHVGTTDEVLEALLNIFEQNEMQ